MPHLSTLSASQGHTCYELLVREQKTHAYSHASFMCVPTHWNEEADAQL